jgi:quercetin dioxygenase-like cupin family protein
MTDLAGAALASPITVQTGPHLLLAEQDVSKKKEAQMSKASSPTAARDHMEIRRVVTGHTADGKAVVIQDDVVRGLPVAGGDAQFAIVWKTVQAPVNNDDPTDRSGEPTGLVEPNGSILRMVDLAPHTRSPMHRTDSLDYGIVLTGEVDIELDGGKRTRVHQGDVIVQRGTIHAWINPSSKPCRIAFILLGAKPATVNGRPLPAVMDNISPDK